MKLNEMIARKSGMPEGFYGSKAKWDEVRERFTISKICILQRPARNKDSGEVIVYQDGPRKGEPVPDRQAIMSIKTESGKELLVRTNSRRIVSLYAGDLDREADGCNQFGDEIYIVEAPEGWLRFVAFKQEYANGQKGDVADLEEAEE